MMRFVLVMHVATDLGGNVVDGSYQVGFLLLILLIEIGMTVVY